MENEPNSGGTFVRNRLPWLAGGAALVFYLCTLNPWISFLNLTQVARISGFTWQPEMFGPLYCAATSPLRLLPLQYVPLGLNLFSAVCAALALTLLARAVALLPHDRTKAQRERELSKGALLSVPLAWLPPLLAVLVCGLQLTFWEHATNSTPDMLNLLSLAYVVRALLEYRRDERPAWLYKAALVYGALMTGDWFIFGASPLFLMAIIWLRGLSFFNLGFLVRLTLFGLLGLSFYCLLPLLASLSEIEPLNFWQTLKSYVLGEKNIALTFPRKLLVLMSLTSLLPVFLMAIRSAGRGTDTSQLGVWMAAAVYHVVHLLFLLVCLWVMLDPQFSPRMSVHGTRFDGVPFLSLYFLSALSVGYFSGYFLLVFKPVVVRARRTPSMARLLHRSATTGVIVLALAAPAMLLIKNWPTLRATNRSPLAEFAREAGKQLPRRGCLIADDTRQLFAIRTWLAQAGRERDLVVVEGLPLALDSPAYHHYLRKQYGAKWPADPQTKVSGNTNALSTLEVFNRFAKSGELFYLHPSFGPFFEHFYAEPHGLVFKLQPFAPEALLPPPLSPQIVAENQAFWERAAREFLPEILGAIRPQSPEAKSGLRAQLCLRLHLPAEPPIEARASGAIYSRTLNSWAVALQNTGDFVKAASHFALAQELYPDNVVAQANLEYNKKFRAGERPPLEKGRSLEDRFGRFDTWERILTVNGPYDEPSLLFALGRVYMERRLHRQAAQTFDRVHALAPDDAPTQLYLSELNLIARKTDRALELARDLVEHPERFNLSSTNRADALGLEARVHFLRNEPQKAEALLEAAIQAALDDNYLMANAIAVYTENARFTNALAVVDRQLKRHPEEPAALLNKGFLHIQLNAFDDAIRTMNQLLTLQTNRPDALLNRAIAYLRSEQLDLAQKDYEKLQALYPNARQIYYGLGEIAYRRKDTSTAIKRYESYMSNSIPGAAETHFVTTRLKELKTAPASKP